MKYGRAAGSASISAREGVVDAERDDPNLRRRDVEISLEVVDGALVVGNDARRACAQAAYDERIVRRDAALVEARENSGGSDRESSERTAAARSRARRATRKCVKPRARAADAQRQRDLLVEAEARAVRKFRKVQVRRDARQPRGQLGRVGAHAGRDVPRTRHLERDVDAARVHRRNALRCTTTG